MSGRAWSESEVEYEVEVNRPGIESEINHELDRDERREINRRVKWAQEQRAAAEQRSESHDA